MPNLGPTELLILAVLLALIVAAVIGVAVSVGRRRRVSAPYPGAGGADLATRVRELKSAGRTEQAVHLVRGETGMGRREAELFVDGL
ncbi:hypothetical protein FHS43_001780 [Streptosporangium becharense]|uniref:Ribosomal protein L7/L12 C-terminal domain-containing protein n=1 Tax=Streptosporangium becharense TaxID=1816182 RepID=A0A7W9IM43_9ACTN|nr:hypothetical protein [Streptosporangium becharense]MBB2910517.1 hypothetical protein [Streptosporangium becharense]MBB5823260.1 hypothetical protein [Streptosporangium becharense]